ncbi:5-formyltetrahydrofolate cyclo-ligase family protein [Phycisphaerae bacterium RAS1]|nr:5-formyltetrahydrofolate cyclo-ligase family protein [Phycisphaerae bacterium RAS1]
MTKKELRQQLRERLAAIPEADRAARSAAACRLLGVQAEFVRSETVMLFLSLPTEVDTSPLALLAWQLGKRVLAPSVSWEQRRMAPIEIHSLTSGLETVEMGIRQPVEGAVVPISEIDLVVVPGLGFDETGNRVGRGRGFYDRFLAHREFRAITCGLAFEEQVVTVVPADEHDMRVQFLVTDARVRRFDATTA